MSLIDSVKYFACGSCLNRRELIFRGEPKGELVFPAGVFLLHHQQLGYILYDTGYASDVMTPTLRNLAYRLPNPIKMTQEETIDAQLLRQGVSPDEVTYVLISHLHPDHIGRLKAFPKAQFILTRACYQTYLKPSWRELVFRDYFPDDFEKRLTVLDLTEESMVVPGQPCQDLFGDGSLEVYSLDGHAKGQLCLYIKERQLLLAADTLWRLEFLEKLTQMRWLPRLVQSSYSDYLTSSQVLRDCLAQGIKVLVSHEDSRIVEEVLGE